MHLHEPFEYRAHIDPDLGWTSTGEEWLSYGLAARRVASLANAFVELGLAPGARVAILARNCPEYSLFYLAASKAGVVPVPLNFRLAPREWQYILEDSEARALLAHPCYADAIDEFRPHLPRLDHLGTIGGARPGWTPLAQWLGGEPLSVVAARERAWPELSQVYTSGTTGPPKGVVMSQRAALAVLMQYRIAYGLGPGERMLLVVPMYHMGGVFWTGFAGFCGVGLYVLSEFDPHDVMRVLDEERIAFTFLVPAMIQACVTDVRVESRRQYGDLRLIGYGASPIAESTLRRAIEEFRCEFVQAFGMTEAPNLTYLTPADHQRALRDRPELLLSAGRAGPGSAVKIVDDENRELPAGEIGEICGTGPQLMSGYWKRPEATAVALRGGWMHTGDVGSLDGDGYLYIKDRSSDMIVSGGENIYPREVEDALFTHPSVADVAVIGVPSERWGEEVKAFVVLAPGGLATADALMAWCKGSLAAFKRPRSVEFVERLPRNASGKVLKRQLREPYWRRVGRQVS
jgi:acyl-CoA synthetase (AMP-forming)/AMP-acid ligase II